MIADRIIAWSLAFALAFFPGLASAQSPQVRAAVLGYQVPAAAAATYQGPGDVFTTSPYAAYSCAEAFTAAYAASLGAACDVVDTATGLVTCTYHFQSNGKVNPSECNGVGQSCQTACSVKQAYDQTGNGRHVLQATLASMPGLTFSSTPTGTLPAITCAGAQLLATSGTVTQAQPLMGSAVFNRNGAVQAGGLLGANATVELIAGSSGANQVATIAGGAGISVAATDNAWHAASSLVNGNVTASAINADGSDILGAAGTTGFSANNIRLCRAAGVEFLGLIAEAAIWSTTSTPTDRGNFSSNAHSSGRYNF